jgi:hypothetical protein
MKIGDMVQHKRRGWTALVLEVNDCSGLYKYAVSLEDENARLNRLYGECRDNASR